MPSNLKFKEGIGTQFFPIDLGKEEFCPNTMEVKPNAVNNVSFFIFLFNETLK
jgi:hypothetical protein